MAEKRAAFSLRRRRSLGFSKCRWLRTTFKVPSRSIFFLRRRRALSTDSPFFSLISVNPIHFLSERPQGCKAFMANVPVRSEQAGYFGKEECQPANPMLDGLVSISVFSRVNGGGGLE